MCCCIALKTHSGIDKSEFPASVPSDCAKVTVLLLSQDAGKSFGEVIWIRYLQYYSILNEGIESVLP